MDTFVPPLAAPPVWFVAGLAAVELPAGAVALPPGVWFAAPVPLPDVALEAVEVVPSKFLKDGGTSSCAEDVCCAGNPYFSLKVACWSCSTPDEKLGPMCPNQIHIPITETRDTPITSIAHAT